MVIWPVEGPVKATLGSPCDSRIPRKCLLLPLAQQGAQQDPTQKGPSASRQKRADDRSYSSFGRQASLQVWKWKAQPGSSALPGSGPQNCRSSWTGLAGDKNRSVETAATRGSDNKVQRGFKDPRVPEFGLLWLQSTRKTDGPGD